MKFVVTFNINFFLVELPGLPREDQAGGLPRDSGQWGGSPGTFQALTFFTL